MTEQEKLNYLNLVKIQIAYKIISELLPDAIVLQRERLSILKTLTRWEDRLGVILK